MCRNGSRVNFRYSWFYRKSSSLFTRTKIFLPPLLSSFFSCFHSTSHSQPLPCLLTCPLSVRPDPHPMLPVPIAPVRMQDRWGTVPVGAGKKDGRPNIPPPLNCPAFLSYLKGRLGQDRKGAIGWEEHADSEGGRQAHRARCSWPLPLLNRAVQ